MTKRQSYLIIITLLLFITAVGFETYLKYTINLGRYISEIETFIHTQEKEVDLFFKETDFIKFQVFKTEADIDKDSGYDKEIAKLADKPFTINIYKEDSLVFWSNNHAEPLYKDLRKPSVSRESKFINLDNGYYQQIKQSYKDPALSNSFYSVIALIPIKYEYSLSSDYLNSYFVADSKIPPTIEVTNNRTEYPIKSRRGSEICYLDTNGPLKEKMNMQLLLFLYLAAFSSFIVFINSIAKTIAQTSKAWIGALSFALCVFGFKMIANTLDLSQKFSDLPLFKPTVNSSFLGESIGDLIINIVLLLWIMLFFHRDFPLRKLNNLSRPKSFAVATLNYFSIFMGFAVILFLLKSLVIDTNIEFNFDNILDLRYQAVLAMVSIILMLVSFFLYTHRMMLTVHNMEMVRRNQYFALGISALLAAPILTFIAPSLEIPSIGIFAFPFFYIMLFQMFIQSSNPPFVWLLAWVFIFSAFPATMILKYNIDKDRIERIGFAKDLSLINDLKAEANILKIRSDIMADTVIRKVLNETPSPFRFNRDIVQDRLSEYFSGDPYLFNNYGFDFYAFRKADKRIAIKDQKKTHQELIAELGKQYNSDYREISYYSSVKGKLGYLFEVNKMDESQPIELMLVINRQVREYSKVYTELLIDNQFKNFVNLNKYNFGIYKGGERFDHHGDNYPTKLEILTVPKKGEHLENVTERGDIAYRSHDDVISLISRQGDGRSFWQNWLGIFAYIFTMITLIMFAIGLGNWFFGMVTNSKTFLNKDISLTNKLQFSVIAMILSAFIMIAFVSIMFFNSSSQDYHEARLERKTRSVMTDAKHELEILKIEKDSISELKKMVDALSEIHRMDLNLFDLNGTLISSSENDIYDKKIITKKMVPTAYRALSIKNDYSFITSEKIGALTYKAAYVPLENTQEVKLAYLGLPYYSKQRKQRTDVYAFMGHMMSVYVFLLIVAGIVAIFVANNITKPISQLEAKLKNIEIGKSNELIEWDTNDELGRLIHEYNNMILKLDEKVKLLAKSEREGAWREMAQQVTHEINNPLTPMKLNMQHMVYFLKTEKDPDVIAKRVTDVSATVIQQIDNLSKISREFANFVKMPRAENKQFYINDLVNSSFQLYDNQVDEACDWKLQMPDDKYTVFGDINQISRVLTNLLKNAKEAIPDSRKGNIKLELFKKEEKIVIKVTDNGEGIPEDKQDRVFVPNFTTKRSGTGLGLAISKSIINAIDGEIYFETKVGIGTKFYIVLPLVDANVGSELETVS